MPDLPPIPDRPRDPNQGHPDGTSKPKPSLDPEQGSVDPNRAERPKFDTSWTPSAPNNQNQAPREDTPPVPAQGGRYSTESEVPKGPYSKGLMWKWGARIQGGGTILFGLLVLLGSFGSGLVFFLFGLALAAGLTFHVALKADPTLEKLASRPGGGLVGLAFSLQDRLGDSILTWAWNAVRRSTDFRV